MEVFMPVKHPEQQVQKTFSTRNDIPPTTRSACCQLLNVTLAATLDLWTQLKQAHWNVKGRDFYQLHLLFDEIANTVYEYIDMVAERITALAGVANGTVRQSAHNSFLLEYPSIPISEREHLEALADRLATYVKHVREAIVKTDELDDQASNDLYIEIARAIDQKQWFVEAHLQNVD
jgi:starvation-inducible DNA-binding protein